MSWEVHIESLGIDFTRGGEEKRGDGGQFPRFKATIQNIRAQIVQFSDRKRWVIVLLVFFKPFRHPTIATVTHVGKLIPPPETH